MLMATPPLRGRTPIFIGDDVTDEDGIAAAIALGGMGFRVPEAFGDAAGVRRWLGTLAGSAEGADHDVGRLRLCACVHRPMPGGPGRCS